MRRMCLMSPRGVSSQSAAADVLLARWLRPDVNEEVQQGFLTPSLLSGDWAVQHRFFEWEQVHLVVQVICF